MRVRIPRRALACLGALALGCASAAPASPAPEAPAEPPVSQREQPTEPDEAREVAEPPTEAAEPELPTDPVPPAIRIPLEDEDRIDDTVALALRRGRMPGAVVVIGRSDGVVFRRAYGKRALVPEEERMTVDTMFDLASLTKPVVTATAISLLVQDGTVDLEQPVASYVPEFAQNGKDEITVAQLLTHTGGLPAVDSLSDYEDGPETAIEHILAIEPTRPPGAYEYSDLGFIVLGVLVERVTGEPLDRFAREHIFQPLGMDETTFRPGPELRERIAPTERSDQRDPELIRGEVHDPRAWRLGGVAGNAGLFSTAGDLSRFARMYLSGGEIDGTRLLSAETVRRFTEPTRAGRTWRTLGWNAERGGAYGHGGFTGTSLWIDPEADLFVLLLSNRVHPDGGGDVRALVRHLRLLAQNAVTNAAPPPPEGTRVLTGIDVLRRDRFRPLAGKRIGLITNASGRARDGRSTVELLTSAPDVQVVALFAPEHGLRASQEGRMGDGVDPQTGLPVFSLFGARRRPSPASLRGIDTLVFDVQDVGARFYTYASTMLEAMRAAAEQGVDFVVLDRPNPLGGVRIAGPVLDTDDDELRSFVNYHALPVRHGMTIGELARLLNAELDVDANLTVVRVEGWRPEVLWRDTGLRWVPPSPNLQTPEQVLLYPGIALLEGTNLSVGRGTDEAFELVGAPWIDEEPLAEQLRAAQVPGVSIEAARFVPRAGPYRGRWCKGVRIRVTDPAELRSIRLGLEIARALLDHHRQSWETERLALMIGDRALTQQLIDGASAEDVLEASRQKLAAFFAVRQQYLLYPRE